MASGDEACVECITGTDGVDDINWEAGLPQCLIARTCDCAIGSQPCDDKPIVAGESCRSLDGIREAGKWADLVDGGPQHHV